MVQHSPKILASEEKAKTSDKEENSSLPFLGGGGGGEKEPWDGGRVTGHGFFLSTKQLSYFLLTGLSTISCSVCMFAGLMKRKFRENSHTVLSCLKKQTHKTNKHTNKQPPPPSSFLTFCVLSFQNVGNQFCFSLFAVVV